MADVVRAALGKSMYNGWMLRRRLTERVRPRMTVATGLLMVFVSMVAATEGILLGWFFESITPETLAYTLLGDEVPWIGTNGWIAGVTLITVGVFGFFGGLAIARRRSGGSGTYMSLLLVCVILATGIVLLVSGSGYSAPFLTWMGAVDVVLAVSSAVMLGLCWYTMDPLGLHWSSDGLKAPDPDPDN